MSLGEAAWAVGITSDGFYLRWYKDPDRYERRKAKNGYEYRLVRP